MVSSREVDFDNLFEERSLAQLYRQAPSFFETRSNTIVLGICFAILVTFSIVHLVAPSVRDGMKIEFTAIFLLWANTGAALAGTILGFLIAGFAILCTVIRPSTAIALQSMRSKKYATTQLKVMLLSFVSVFVEYLLLLLISILFIVFGSNPDIFTLIGDQLNKLYCSVSLIIVHVVFVCWGTWLIFLALSLKSFVYNLYQALLLVLADSATDSLAVVEISASNK